MVDLEKERKLFQNFLTENCDFEHHEQTYFDEKTQCYENDCGEDVESINIAWEVHKKCAELKQSEIDSLKAENETIQQNYSALSDKQSDWLDERQDLYADNTKMSDEIESLKAENARLKKALAQAMGGFTSIEDGLPEEGAYVIAFDAIQCCQFVGGEFLEGYREHDTGYEYSEPVEVSHWKGVAP